MSVIRITREFSFEMAHVLGGYDGLCREVHGHSYRLLVTVRGAVNEAEGSPKLGMVVDFGVLKRVVGELVVGRLDHALVLREGFAGALDDMFERVVRVPFQPTCENLVEWLAGLIGGELPRGVELWSLRLYETANSFAEWFAGDNV